MTSARRIGIPREIKVGERRVSATPTMVAELTRRGHKVVVERGAGVGAGMPDCDYLAVGATITDSHREAYDCDLVLKVKEPVTEEFSLLKTESILFTYLHLAPLPDLTTALMEKKITAIAYETVTSSDGALPLLTPMSEIAGKLAAQVGSNYLLHTYGGMGLLAGGVPGILPANVLIIGGGVAGTNAARVALGLGAKVAIADVSIPKLRHLEEIFGDRVGLVFSERQTIRTLLPGSQLVIGAVLVKGAKAPHVLNREDIALMPKGAVFVDIAIDQGGCSETSRPTTHAEPVFKCEGVLHYCVTNMPGAVPLTSTLALTNATYPYVMDLADYGEDALSNEALAAGLNVMDGKILLREVAEAQGRSI